MSEVLHPEEKITSVYLVRHGSTKEAESGKIYSDPDVLLSEKGLKQAEALAAWLKSIEVDYIISSPAARVLATTNLLIQAKKIPSEICPSLNEIYSGEWEGKSYLEIKKTAPEQYERWLQDPFHRSPPGGESIAQLKARVIDDFDKIIHKHEGKKILLVTHAGVIRSIIVHALKMQLEDFWRLVVPTGTISKVDISPSFSSMHFMSLQP